MVARAVITVKRFDAVVFTLDIRHGFGKIGATPERDQTIAGAANAAAVDIEFVIAAANRLPGCGSYATIDKHCGQYGDNCRGGNTHGKRPLRESLRSLRPNPRAL